MPSDPTLKFDKAVILGATGPTGIHLANVLKKQGLKVRAVSRSLENLERRFPAEGVDRFPADALNADDIAEPSKASRWSSTASVSPGI